MCVSDGENMMIDVMYMHIIQQGLGWETPLIYGSRIEIK